MLVERLQGVDWLETSSLVQLVPEIASELTSYGRFIVADAGTRFCLAPVQGAESGPLSHHTTPSALLGMCRHLYQHEVEGWVLEIPAFEFGLSCQLSAAARSAVERATNFLLSVDPDHFPTEQIVLE